MHRVPVYKRPIFILGIALVAAAFLIFLFLRPRTPEAPESDVPTASETPASIPNEPTANDAPEEPEAPAGPAQYEGGNPNTLPSLTGHIAYKNIQGSTLSVSVSIDQYLASGGECILELSQNSRVVRTVKKAATPDVTTSACGPFSIDLTGLPRGEYSLNVRLDSNGKYGVVSSIINY